MQCGDICQQQTHQRPRSLLILRKTRFLPFGSIAHSNAVLQALLGGTSVGSPSRSLTTSAGPALPCMHVAPAPMRILSVRLGISPWPYWAAWTGRNHC